MERGKQTKGTFPNSVPVGPVLGVGAQVHGAEMDHGYLQDGGDPRDMAAGAVGCVI